jgi:hypothetical protein
MSYVEFGDWFLVGKLTGCFLAFAIALRGHRDGVVLAIVYGSWVAFVYALTHTLITDPMHNLRAPQILGYWWYLFQAIAAVFPVICVWSLTGAGAQRIFAALGLTLVAVDLTFFAAAAPWLIGHRLPGWAFFDLAATLESLQVLALVFLNTVSRRGFARLGRSITKLGRWRWTDHKRLAARRI